MNTSNQNIISITDWKHNLENKTEEKSLTNYLKVLSFHDLMVEAEVAMSDLRERNLDLEISRRSKQIMIEFNNRLKESGHNKELDEVLALTEKKTQEFFRA